MLGITTLHNGMILSTLSIKSHGFVLGFLNRHPQQLSPRTKYTVLLCLSTHSRILSTWLSLKHDSDTMLRIIALIALLCVSQKTSYQWR